MHPVGPLLIVDDNDDDLNLTKTILHKAGGVAHLVTFAGGEELIDFLEANDGETPPLGVILDIRMPRHTGLETLAWIRAQPRFDRLPVVMWSSSDDPRDVARASDLGAQCYFGKYPPVPAVQGMLAAMASFGSDSVDVRVFPVRGNLLLGRATLADAQPQPSV